MPYAAAKPCRHQACGKLVHDGSGYCENHKADSKVNKFADDRRGSAHERGYGSAWRKLREDILRRDNGLCQPCLKAGRVSIAKQVDHITQKKDGGTDDPANLQAICVPCHKSKTAREASHGRGV